MKFAYFYVKIEAENVLTQNIIEIENLSFGNH